MDRKCLPHLLYTCRSQDYYTGGCRPRLTRLRVDPATGTVTEARPLLEHRTVEFPSVSRTVTGRRHSMIYCTADTVGHDHFWGPARALMRLTLPSDDDSDEGDSHDDKSSVTGRHATETEAPIDTSLRLPLLGKTPVGKKTTNSSIKGSTGGSTYDSTTSKSGASTTTSYSNILEGPGTLLRHGTASAEGSLSGSRGGNHVVSVNGARVGGVSDGGSGELPLSIPAQSPSGGAPQIDFWSPGPRSFCGEPMLVPKPGGGTREDDAWIIVGVHNADTLKADIVIFDAARCGYELTLIN